MDIYIWVEKALSPTNDSSNVLTRRKNVFSSQVV